MKIIILISVLISGSLVYSADFPAQGRLFLGTINANPSNLNDELTAQGLQDMKTIGKYGVEITYPVVPWLNIGINYSKRNQSRDEVGSSSATAYEAILDQDVVLLVARLPVYKNGLFLIDIFGGVGGSNTTFTIKTATQNGELSRKESNDWYSAFASNVGVSGAVGHNNIYFFIEAGMEINKVDSFQRTGTINNNIQTIDSTGAYINVGVVFDGIKARSSN